MQTRGSSRIQAIKIAKQMRFGLSSEVTTKVCDIACNQALTASAFTLTFKGLTCITVTHHTVQAVFFGQCRHDAASVVIASLRPAAQ